MDASVHAGLHLRLFLLYFNVPDGCRMRSQREPQADDVREEQQDCGEPAVRPDSLEEETVINSGHLGEVAASAVFVWSIGMPNSNYDA